MLTAIDPATRYPEALPIQFIENKVDVKCLLELFSESGLPREIQGDRGFNFVSRLPSSYVPARCYPGEVVSLPS